jgi:hypothetical protein
MIFSRECAVFYVTRARRCREAQGSVCTCRQVKVGARADLDVAASAVPSQSDARFEIAALYENLAVPDAAIAQLNLWIDAHPEDIKLAAAYNQRCWIRALHAQTLDGALDDCNKAVHLLRTAATLDSRGLAELHQGQTAKGRTDLAAAQAIDPGIEAWAAQHGLTAAAAP